METKPNNVNDEQNFDEIVEKKKKLKKRNKIIAVVAALVVLVLGIFFCYTKLFVVKNITVEFEGERIPYTAEEVILSSGIKKETPLYEIREDDVKQNTRYSLPYVTVEVKKKWPSSIVIKAKKKPGRFYMSVSGKLYILSEDLVVLEKTTDIEKIETDSLVFVKLPAVSECIEGQKAAVDENTEEILGEIVTLLSKYGMLSGTKEIDMSNRFDIRMNYDSKYYVKFGDIKNAEQKIQLMKLTIEDKIKSGESGIIDVSNEKIGVFKPY